MFAVISIVTARKVFNTTDAFRHRRRRRRRGRRRRPPPPPPHHHHRHHRHHHHHNHHHHHDQNYKCENNAKTLPPFRCVATRRAPRPAPAPGGTESKSLER